MLKTQQALALLRVAVSVFGVSAMILFSLRGAVVHAGESSYSLSGFGTVGFVHSSEDRADYVAGQLRPAGAGFSRSWSHEVDSRLGLQLDAAFTDHWSAVVQVITEQRHDDSYKPTLEWANLAYSPHPDISFRIGRIVLPTFIVADTRKVNYANPWLRPPPEVYQLIPLTSSDGFDMHLRMRAGRWTHTTQLSLGRVKLRIPPNATLYGEKMAGLYQTAESGALTLRVSYGRAKLGFAGFDELFDAFRSFGPQGAGIADRFSVDGKLATVWNVGASYQPLEWFVMAEFGSLDTRSAFGASSAWYASLGRRIADFTPYIVYARLWRNDETSTPGLDATSLPPPLAVLATGLNAELNSILASAAQQNTLSIGVRWDYKPGMAFKLQFDHVDVTRGSPGMFTNIQPGHVRGSNVNLFSVSLDFVF